MKFDLKNNPELARQRHNEQTRAFYQKNKEEIKAKRRKGGIYFKSRKNGD